MSHLVVTLLVGCVQARWTLAKLRQRFKDGGVLFDSPNEVVPTTAQNVQWFDPVLLQKPLNGLFTGSWMANTRFGLTNAPPDDRS